MYIFCLNSLYLLEAINILIVEKMNNKCCSFELGSLALLKLVMGLVFILESD